jgi:protein phosphatase
VKFAGKSDKGLMRSRNEDAFCIERQDAGNGAVVMAVADGMGGHRAGNVASMMAIEYIRESLEKEPIQDDSFFSITEKLRETIKIMNERILKKSVTDPECEGMGTTLTVAVVGKTNAVVAHVGDSGAFHFSEGKMNKVTTDHTYVEELVRTGTLTREQALIHPQRNYITKVVGCFDRVNADFYSVDLKAGDRMLLCSDGLNKMMDDSEILRIIYSSDDPESICAEYVNAANQRGGVDNITAVVYLNFSEAQNEA